MSDLVRQLRSSKFSLPALMGLDTRHAEDRNSWYMVVEIFWASILGSCGAFNAVFALHLQATNTDIGLLSSIPALLAVLISIPAGKFLQSRKRQSLWVLGNLTLVRTGYLLVALTPWVSFIHFPQGKLVVFILIAMAVPSNIFNVGFLTFQAGAIPEQRRAAIFAARNITSAATTSVCIFLYGLWLGHITLPINYQAMYIFGYITSLISVYYLIKIKLRKEAPDTAENEPTRDNTKTRHTLVDQILSLPLAFKDSPNFRRLTLNTLFVNIGLWIVSPLYIIYYVRHLGATDAWIGLQGMIGNVSIIIAYIIWRRLISRWGYLLSLQRSIVLMGLYPIIVGFSPGLTSILFATMLNSLFAAGVNLSHINTMLKVTPEERRTEYYALYITTMNIAAIAMPLVGVFLADRIGFPPVFVLCGALSILGGLSFWLWPPKTITD